MTAQECFGVVIRTLGLLMLFYGMYFLFTAAYLYFAPQPQIHTSFSTYVTYSVALGTASLYFLRGAPALVAFCYPQSATAGRMPTQR